MRSDISHAAMTTDFVLQASADQSELSNVRNVTSAVNLKCPIYHGCSVVGYGTPSEAAAASSGQHESFGCNTTATTARPFRVGDLGLAAVGGVGLVALRLVRRRRQNRKR